MIMHLKQFRITISVYFIFAHHIFVCGASKTRRHSVSQPAQPTQQKITGSPSRPSRAVTTPKIAPDPLFKKNTLYHDYHKSAGALDSLTHYTSLPELSSLEINSALSNLQAITKSKTLSLRQIQTANKLTADLQSKLVGKDANFLPQYTHLQKEFNTLQKNLLTKQNKLAHQLAQENATILRNIDKVAKTPSYTGGTKKVGFLKSNIQSLEKDLNKIKKNYRDFSPIQNDILYTKLTGLQKQIDSLSQESVPKQQKKSLITFSKKITSTIEKLNEGQEGHLWQDTLQRQYYK